MAGESIRGTGPLDPRVAAQAFKGLPAQEAKGGPQGQGPGGQEPGAPGAPAKAPSPPRMAGDRRALTGPLSLPPTGTFDFAAPRSTQPGDAGAKAPGQDPALEALQGFGKAAMGTLEALRPSLGAADSAEGLATATDAVAASVDLAANSGEATQGVRKAIQQGLKASQEAATPTEGLGRGLGTAAVVTGLALAGAAVGKFMNGEASPTETLQSLTEGVGTSMSGLGDMLGKAVGAAEAGGVTTWAKVAGAGMIAAGAVGTYRGLSTLYEGTKPNVDQPGGPPVPLDGKDKVSAGLEALSGAATMVAGAAMLVPGGQAIAAAAGLVAGAAALAKLAVDHWDTIQGAAKDPVGTAKAVGEAAASWIQGAGAKVSAWFSSSPSAATASPPALASPSP